MRQTEHNRKVALAIAYMRVHGDTQRARDESAQNADTIDTYQWRTASLIIARERRNARRYARILTSGAIHLPLAALLAAVGAGVLLGEWLTVVVVGLAGGAR